MLQEQAYDLALVGKVYLWNVKISKPSPAHGKLDTMDDLKGTLYENIQDLAGIAKLRPW